MRIAVVALVSCAGAQSPSSSGGACTTDTICLRTSKTAPLEHARLVVVWESLDERSKPEVAFDVPFRGDERAIAIPHAKIAKPRAPSTVMPCDPERGAQCRRGVAVAVGYVLVLRDADGNGHIDAGEVGKRGVLGAARVIVGFAEDAIEPSDFALAGMSIGIASYEPVRVRMFDKWKLAPPRTVFELVVCAADDADCDPPIPNVT